MLFRAATLYGCAKSFFWPTTLGTVSEQYPRGGALLLNAMGGVGMIAVGTIGGPAIGTLQDMSYNKAVAVAAPEFIKKLLPKKPMGNSSTTSSSTKQKWTSANLTKNSAKQLNSRSEGDTKQSTPLENRGPARDNVRLLSNPDRLLPIQKAATTPKSSPATPPKTKNSPAASLGPMER